MPAATPTWGPNNKHRLLNTRLPRVDGPDKACGTAVYTYDVHVPGMLYARILRSPHAHARVTSVDLTAAKKIRGVAAAVAALTDIRYEGAPVAAVAATTAEIADDAIHAITVQYDVLPHAVTGEQAIAHGAPDVYPGDRAVHNNIRAGQRRGNAARVETALAACDAVIEAEYRTPTLHHCCLESHGVVVDYRGGESATVYCSTQGTFTIPGDSSRALELAESSVRGIVQYMGGGFGSKSGIGIEGKLACQLSKIAGLPVKLMLNRKDEFVMAGNGGGSWQKFKAGASADGTAVAIHATQFAFGGVGRGSLAPQPYIYHFANVYLESSSIHTNADSSRPLRAPGNPPACFGIESVMDELAYKIGMDPLEFRKKNLLDAAYHRQLDRAAREIGWVNRNPVPGAWPGTIKRGFGCAVGQWGGGGRAGCDVNVRVGRDGSVVAAVGTQDLGTGTRTYIRAIVAEELGLEMTDVLEKIGDSTLGNANYSGGSSTAASLAPVVKSAAFNARMEIARRVAPLLGGTEDQIVFADRQVSCNGQSLTWSQACGALPAGGLSVGGQWQRDLATNRTHGACCAIVDVDVETGHVQPIKMVHVQDVGLPLNRLAVESQINGGMVQGVGMALLEGRINDPTLGVMVNSSFMDYKIPGCLEQPQYVPLIDDDDPRTAVVGVGEPPAVPPAAAIASAVYNACGVRVRELPITPDKILMGLAQKG